MSPTRISPPGPRLPPPENSGRKFAKPVPQSKTKNYVAWLVFISFVCFFVALWAPLNRLYYRYINRFVEPVVTGERDAHGFLAISYEGVAPDATPGSKLVTPERFTDHIHALQAAGYTPIGLQDIVDFYKDGRPLPRKALLLTFEKGRRSTYFSVRDILSRNRWHAVMGVATKSVREKDSSSLLRPYLKDMLLSANWDLAVESDDGYQQIPTNPRGSEAPFFSALKWLATMERFEDPGEFRHRLEADHIMAVREFTDALRTKPVAFFFPYGNYGQFGANGRMYREINLELLRSRYTLGFTLGALPYNDADTDPYFLNRLEVPSDLSGAELVRRLDNCWPTPPLLPGQEATINSGRWISDWGQMLYNPLLEGFIEIMARPPENFALGHTGATKGARAWVAGSNGFRDGFLAFRFRIDRGTLFFYIRYRGDDDCVRVAINEYGRVVVSQISPGEEERQLATADANADVDFRSVHDVLFVLRDHLLFVQIDNKLLFGSSVHLDRNHIHSGMVGVGVWDATLGVAKADILSAKTAARNSALLTWSPIIARDTIYLQQQLEDLAFSYTMLSPPWLDLEAGSASPSAAPDWDVELFKLITTDNNGKIFPSIILHDAASAQGIDFNMVVEKLLKTGSQGVFIDAKGLASSDMPAFRAWQGNLYLALQKRGLRCALRLPPIFRGLASIGEFLAAQPETYIVTSDGTPPPGIDRSRMRLYLEIEPPDDTADFGFFHQITDFSQASSEGSSRAAILRRQGLDAYSSGRYREAIDHWTKWQAENQHDAEPWTLIGNARARLRENTKAIEAYRNSLALNPGQTQLAITLSRLLEEERLDKESAELLNLYARAYPQDVSIATAQAQWLDRHGQRKKAQDVMRKLVARHPRDASSRTILQTFLDTPKARYENMHQLLALGNSADTQLLGFGQDLASAEILTVPEASIFFDFIRETASNAAFPVVRKFYSNFLPITHKIDDNLVMDKLSADWGALGTPMPATGSGYALQANADMSEAYLRLYRSELIRDGFIEVTIDESTGAFWLYARRSSRSMIRFGFDGDGFLRLQTWFNGDIRTSDSRAWIRPPGSITLRLEVRGDGASGFVNGEAVYSTPLPIPADICYGWWSVAPFSPELGLARARINRISAGPLSPTMLLMNERSAAGVSAALDRIRPCVGDLTAIAPVAFTQEPNGTVPVNATIDLMPFRMFCSYNRLRLVPVVALDYFSDVNPALLVKIIKTNRLSGLVLLVRTMPKEKWFKEMASLIEETSSDLVVIASANPIWTSSKVETPEAARAEQERLLQAEPLEIREIQRGSVIFLPSNRDWTSTAKSYPKWCATANMAQVREDYRPSIVVLPKGFAMIPDDEPPTTADKPVVKKVEDIKPVQVYLPGEEPEPAKEETEEEVKEEVPDIGDIPAPTTNAVPPAAEAPASGAEKDAKSLLDQTKKIFHSLATSAMEAVSGPTAPSETLKTSDPGTK